MAPPGVKLFSDYCSQAPEADLHGSSSSSPWKARFKATMRCQNIDEFGLPSFISAYNGKPVLIRHTGTLIRYIRGLITVTHKSKFTLDHITIADTMILHDSPIRNSICLH